MNKSIILLIFISVFLSGCSQLGGTYFKRSYVSITGKPENTIGTILVWEADTSAAILFKDGGACMQTALAIKTVNAEAEGKLSDAILNISSAANQIAKSGSNTASSEALVEASGSIKEAASMLTTTTERTAFLNMGMFYMCQIAANKSITKEQADKLIESLIKSASGMKKL